MRWLRTRPAVQVGLVALVVGAVAQWAAHRADVVHAFWDAQAHLDIARRVWDATTPGLQMLGTVWLPIPHLLYLPFTLHDPWWWNGFAGGIVGWAAFVATAMATFAIADARAGRGWGWVAALVVITNPSLLYLQTTAMTEPILLAFLTGSVWALDRWLRDTTETRSLLVAGTLAALAVGSRYDGWFYAAVAGAVVLAHTRRLGPVARFAVPVALMIALWLGYNAVFFGDPLEFQRGAWSAESQQAALAAQGELPAQGDLIRSISQYGGAMVLTTGAMTLAIAITVLGPAMTTPGNGTALLLLWTALPFNLLALWAGQSVIKVPWADPMGVVNVRYGMLVLPAAAVTLALGASAVTARWPRLRRGTLLAVVSLSVGQLAWAAFDSSSRVGTLREGLGVREFDPAQMEASRWLAVHYDRGRILVAPAVNVSPRTRIPLRDRVYPWTWELGPAALASPGEHVDWVLVDRRASGDPVTQAVTAAAGFSRTFARVFVQRELEIWRRR